MPQKLRRLRHPGAIAALGQDALWRLSTNGADPPELTWPIAAETARAVQVTWPVQRADRGLLEPVCRELERLVHVTRTEMPQPDGNILVFEFAVDGTRFPVGIDYEDRTVLHERADDLPLLLKHQYAAGGYGRENVEPGGFLTLARDLYALYPRLRALRARTRPRHDLYGRFSTLYAAEVRSRAVTLLETQRRFSFRGGLEPVLWSEFVREACAARLCLDLPGRGPFCYRLVEYMALGCPVVGLRHAAEMHVPLVDGRHIAYAREDLHDLVDVAARRLADDAGLQALGRGAADYFDRFLHPRQLAAYYLDRCLVAARRR
jgi:hypothetical protein